MNTLETEAVQKQRFDLTKYRNRVIKSLCTKVDVSAQKNEIMHYRDKLWRKKYQVHTISCSPRKPEPDGCLLSIRWPDSDPYTWEKQRFDEKRREYKRFLNENSDNGLRTEINSEFFLKTFASSSDWFQR